MEIYIISIRSEIETAKAPWWACPGTTASINASS
jgi:hypothetical protein